MLFKRLDVYRKSYQLALEIHKLSLKFPGIEQRELANQLRRSSKSIPANIAEGMGKQGSDKEVARYIRIALGSNDETRVWLEFSKDLEYIDSNVYHEYEKQYDEVGRMLRGVLKKYS